MALVTGTPVGTTTSAESLYLEGAPSIYIQNYAASPLYNPDANGFYWNLSGTSTYNVYEVGCLTAVSLTENLTINDVLCDNEGVKATIQQRNYLEFTFTVQSFFPFQTLTTLMKGGTVTEAAPVQGFGLGPVNQNQFWMCYAPKVYDETAGDYIMIQLHRAQFVGAFTIDMPFGDKWTLTGITLRAMADSTKPAAQRFATILRADASVIT